MSGGLATYPGMQAVVSLADPGVTLIDFTAAWCAPCKQLTPMLHELEGEYRGRARLLVIDVQEHPDLAQAFRVTAMPTMVLVRDGKEVGRMVGLRPKKIVAGALERALAGHVAITGA
jgi:thioredoxin 1